MLNHEVVDIHARSDRLEQFFVVTIGGIYGFALTKPITLEDPVFVVPVLIALFAFIRMELLSKVRHIIRAKQIEFEKLLATSDKAKGESQITGMAEHFQIAFYDSKLPELDSSVGFRSLFRKKVSDRAVFWRRIVFMTSIVALIQNWNLITNLASKACNLLK